MPTLFLPTLLPTHACRLGKIAVLVVLSGCGASSSTQQPARAPAVVASRARPARASRPEAGIAPVHRSTPRKEARPVRPAAPQNIETVELQIEGKSEENRVPPCQLVISHQGESMVLDFRAESSRAPRIRQQTKELGFYFNNNRGDERAIRAPEGRPDPESFPIRQILGARPIASVEDLPDGARLTLSPDARARTQRLRAEVLWHAGDLLPGLPLAGKACPELPARREAAATSRDR